MTQGEYCGLAASKAASTRKKYMVVYNHRLDKFSVRRYGSYTVNEELVAIY